MSSKPTTSPKEETESFGVNDCSKASFAANRVEIESVQPIYLSLCLNVDTNKRIIYEVIYSRALHQVVFQIYWSIFQPQARQIFDACKEVLKEFEVPTTKKGIQDLLKGITGALKMNRLWTVAHVCAKIGCDNYFSTVVPSGQMINSQVEPDRYTPLHIAIQCQRESTVKAILAAKPNVTLVERKKNNVLHYAAISSVGILRMFLTLPETMALMLKRNEMRSTPLHLACYGQKFENLFEMLRIGLTVRMLTLEPPECNDPIIDDNVSNDPNSPFNKVVHFTEQDIDELDLQDVRFGGTPLHWATGPRLIDKMLEYSFSLNSLNKIGNRPLHVMVIRSRLKCVLSLLVAGANVNSRNILDWTPLHCAIKSGDITMTQALIVFDADINAKTGEGYSVRHIAATQDQSPLLYLVSFLGANRCPPEMKLCNQGCHCTGHYEPSLANPEKLDFLNDTYDPIFKDFLHGDILRGKTKLKRPQMNMLTCDGGGIKGLITVQALMEVERGLTKPLVHYFRWLSGTSTGSFIVVMLAMGKTLSQVRTCYFSMKNRVCANGQKPYNAELVEKMLKEHIGEIKMGELKATFNKMVIVPAVLADRRPMRVHFFRSFQSVEELFQNVPSLSRQIPNLDKDLPSKKIIPNRTDEYAWKACRCSSAAPLYFPPYGGFVDGGLTSNNPCLDALTLYQLQNAGYKALGKMEDVEELDMVLSVGTGITAVEDSSDYIAVDTTISYNNVKSLLNMMSLMIFETCQTEQHVMNRSELFCYSSNIAYFRLNPFLLNLYSIDEQHDSNIIATLWETKLFMYHKRDEIKMIQDYLEGRLVMAERPKHINTAEVTKTSSKRTKNSKFELLKKHISKSRKNTRRLSKFDEVSVSKHISAKPFQSTPKKVKESSEKTNIIRSKEKSKKASRQTLEKEQESCDETIFPVEKSQSNKLVKAKKDKPLNDGDVQEDKSDSLKKVRKSDED